MSICFHCAHWTLYAYFIAREAHEGWRCENGVIDSGKRSECTCYLREVGADDESLGVGSGLDRQIEPRPL